MRGMACSTQTRCCAHLPTRKTIDTACSFSERACYVADIATPVSWQQSTRDITTEAAMWPVAHAGCISVLYWIEMNVIDMAREVSVVADGMLPIATLPNSLVAFRDLAGAPPCICGKPAGETALDDGSSVEENSTHLPAGTTRRANGPAVRRSRSSRMDTVLEQTCRLAAAGRFAAPRDHSIDRRELR
jgi:hypothetical protein